MYLIYRVEIFPLEMFLLAAPLLFHHADVLTSVCLLTFVYFH